ncbi:cell envelope biogenesis protein OmpA [Cellulophaga sp. HaHaR_3_176]|uniref:cell envelope biogenesis protein OmpA n=1 Tax=Cellulophaga sp. HaHaR_3_176 TaxID=1942464 RepID=UPI001C1F433D|nr:cell envelope biogenesis protein OmpA [Cellulophaga sp. HaHaR_3_176]QWX83525.1 cell envelope biogenesis protein OmpA [Cellulophaga sp. HaHaR_3_176]
MVERDKVELLKDILFTDDREFAEKIAKRIEIIEKTVNEREQLSEKVNPIISKQLDDFVAEIPKSLGPTITATLKEEIRKNKEEIVDALYPILGKMIKKYISQEMKMLSERINKKISAQRWKIKFRSWFGGVKEEELILSELSMASIEQVLLIERGSGILAASFSKTKTIDEDMISGMLTAIKGFVEDAFGQKNQNLELIEYELYNIHLQSFVSYYVAVVISGNYSLSSKNKVQDLIFDFYNDFSGKNLDAIFALEGSENKKGVDRISLEKELVLKFRNASI